MLTATGHHVLLKQNKVVKKTGLTKLDELGFEAQYEDERLNQNAVQLGVIVSIGPTAWECFGPNFTGKPWADIGDTVFFPRHCGAYIEDPETGENFVLMTDSDIQVIISEGDNPKFEQKEYKFHPDRNEKRDK